MSSTRQAQAEVRSTGLSQGEFFTWAGLWREKALFYPEQKLALQPLAQCGGRKRGSVCPQLCRTLLSYLPCPLQEHQENHAES